MPGTVAAIDAALAPGEAEVVARARADVLVLFVERSRLYRSTRSALVLCIGYLGMGLLPAIPGGREVFGVGWEISMAFMAVQIANALVGIPVLARFSPLSGPGLAIELVGTCTWIGGAVTMMAVSGTARSVFWFNLSVIVVLVVHTIYNHARILAPLVAGVVSLVAWFALRGQLADAALSALFGFCLCLFQRMSTIYGWRMAQDQARAHLVAERAAALLVEHERKRIERELHDGVAAELTATLWQARSLEGTGRERAGELSEGIQKSLAELRRVIANIRDEPTTHEALAERARTFATALAGGRVALVFDVELAAPGAAVDPERATHVLRVLQEAVRNVVSHASARTVWISLHADEAGGVSLGVEDDGIGFSVAEPRVREGGVENMRARAARLGGSVAWAVRAGGGTRVSLVVPAPPA